jgi:hypothetical protein
MGRPVVHFEIGCRDRVRSAEFFSKLFDWNTQEMGPATKIDSAAGSEINGHITSLGHEPQNYMTLYIEVEDVQACLDKAVTGRQGFAPCPPDSTGAILVVLRS